MKCVMENYSVSGEDRKVIRVDDYKAEQLVKSGSWFYCSKRIWKDKTNRKTNQSILVEDFVRVKEGEGLPNEGMRGKVEKILPNNPFHPSFIIFQVRFMPTLSGQYTKEQLIKL